MKDISNYKSTMMMKTQFWKVKGENSMLGTKSQRPRHSDLLFLVFQEEKPSPCGATV